MEYTYLPLIPKPLLNDFITGRVIPFVGAGFSKNAEIPMGLSMPDWNELGKLAAYEIPDYDYDNNAIDALSYYEDLYSRAKLVELLMKGLHFGEIQPGATYKAFCDLFTGTICTTNFDSLLEDAMTLLHRPVSVVVTKDRLTIGSNNESKIIKLHGDFNHPDKMVITEHDYDVYLEQNPVFATYIANLFITNTMLLIGYSLDDNDFRSIWQIINSRLGSMAQPAYYITVGASPEKIAKYKRRNIRVINLEGEPKKYKIILHDLFVELKDYIDNEKDKTAKSIDERINEQMMIPAENNKLCFVSCAMSRIAQLSALINPVLHNLGITPIRIDDMLMPGDNWIDISQTAIRKSRVAIIDISDSSNNVMLQFGLIKSTKQKKNILILCEEGTSIPVSLIDQPILTYTFDIAREKINYHFVKELTEWSCRVFDVEFAVCDNKRKHTVFADAHRLFEKGEYSACIVSAFSELEYQIPPNYIDSGCEDYDSPPHIFRYVRYLRKAHEGNIKDAHKLIELRNKIVHQGYVATETEARDFLRFVEAVYEYDCKTQE